MTKPLYIDYKESLAKALRDPDEAAGYLEAALGEGDPKFLLTALRDVADAQGGLAAVARKAKLNRVSLYRMLSKDGNPELLSMVRLLGSLGLRIAILPSKPARARKGPLAAKRPLRAPASRKPSPARKAAR